MQIVGLAIEKWQPAQSLTAAIEFHLIFNDAASRTTWLAFATGQGRDNQMATIGSRPGNGINIEAPSLRVLASGIKRAHQGPACQIPDDGQIVAGAEDA